MIKNDLLEAFSEQLKQLTTVSESSPHDFHIALSGGLDSIVLLHLFARLRESEPQLAICAHHINHGLSDNAATWCDFCQQFCAVLKIDFTCSSVHLIKQSRTSLEALAREKRYACLTQNLLNSSYLVTAHHQDDQLETVLLALKRGAGNTGLQGIRSKQTLPRGYLIRPLLGFSREQLERYAKAFELQWIEDESNSDQLFDRNYIRHSITPLLKARWPAIGKTVARSASICEEQQQLSDEIAALDFTTCVSKKLNQQVVAIDPLKKLSVARRHNLLRYWFKKSHLHYPSAKQLCAVWQDLVLAGQDASPKMSFQGVTLRRYRDHLYLVAEQTAAERMNKPLSWTGEGRVSLLAGNIVLNLQLSKEKQAGTLAVPSGADIQICFRDHLPTKLSCTPLGRAGSRSVKKLLHEYHLPPWLRDSVPFILVNGELLQAVGLWQCHTLPTEKACEYLSVSFA